MTTFPEELCVLIEDKDEYTPFNIFDSGYINKQKPVIFIWNMIVCSIYTTTIYWYQTITIGNINYILIDYQIYCISILFIIMTIVFSDVLITTSYTCLRVCHVPILVCIAHILFIFVAWRVTFAVLLLCYLNIIDTDSFQVIDNISCIIHSAPNITERMIRFITIHYYLCQINSSIDNTFKSFVINQFENVCNPICNESIAFYNKTTTHFYPLYFQQLSIQNILNYCHKQHKFSLLLPRVRMSKLSTILETVFIKFMIILSIFITIIVQYFDLIHNLFNISSNNKKQYYVFTCLLMIYDLMFVLVVFFVTKNETYKICNFQMYKNNNWCQLSEPLINNYYRIYMNRFDELKKSYAINYLSEIFPNIIANMIVGFAFEETCDYQWSWYQIESRCFRGKNYRDWCGTGRITKQSVNARF
eukprot:555686_1